MSDTKQPAEGLSREDVEQAIDETIDPQFDGLIVALKQRIRSLRSAERPDGWVAVSERTPDGQYDVLVTDGKFIGIGDCCKGHLWNCGSSILTVTHWRPLPAAPGTVGGGE